MSQLLERPLRVLQITDSHLGSDSGETLVGVNTEQSLRDVMTLINHNHPNEDTIDLVVATGDISNDGKQPSYQRFVETVREFLPNTPLAWLDGNHDDPSGMEIQNIAQPLEEVVELGGWQIILLSSRVPFEGRGELPESELVRLEALLVAKPQTPTLVMLHHQPVPVGCAWIDQYKVANSRRFFEILDPCPQVKGVVWGHVHQEFYLQRDHIGLFATPSTCVQFKPNCDDFTVDNTMPGYRIFDLFPNGKLHTDVIRVEGIEYNIDLSSGGY